jgi:putative hemolysin
MDRSANPFRLSLQPRWLAATIERVLSLHRLAWVYDTRPNQQAEQPAQHADAFMQHTLSALNASLEVNNPHALANIPSEGPVIFVANHPLGGLEGVAMTHLLRQQRPDLKVLTNELLTKIPEFSDVFIGVDVLSKNAAAKNVRGMRQVMRQLQQGGALLIYPAGMVSAINPRNGQIEDRPWSTIIGKLAKQFEASCVPFFVHGRNSRLFYLAGLIHPRLRTALLPRELANKAQRSARLTVGSPILWKDMAPLPDAEGITAYLRTASELLSYSDDDSQSDHPVFADIAAPDRSAEELQTLAADLQGLAEFELIKHRDFSVYCAPFDRLGSIMAEIAIARERTFRTVGEGTGQLSDSDHFDPHYLHLFIWDHSKAAIVGGYRLGRTDEIVRNKGVEGLYSRSLYKFEASYIQRFGGALEVGRSFVTPEYQRHPRALDLLWQGIGRWVVENPGYHTLFGCVSISNEHSARARAFLSDSLMQSFRAEQEYLNDVRPVAPLKVRGRVWSNEVLASLSNITLINKLLGQCDPGKTVPILLRHYLALNGRIVGFSVNSGFNESLDGLIVVDLRKTPTKYLQRYLGKDGSLEFLKLWSLEHAAA